MEFAFSFKSGVVHVYFWPGSAWLLLIYLHFPEPTLIQPLILSSVLLRILGCAFNVYLSP